MRNLKNPDLFKMMRIMRKANIKEDLVKMKLPKGLSKEQSDMMMLFQIIESAPNAEKEIFEFLADVGEVELEVLENDEFELLPDIFKHLMSQEKFTNFLSQAFESMN